MKTHVAADSPSMVMSHCPIPGAGEEDTFTKGNTYLAFGWIRGGQRTFPTCVDSQLPSAENNPYARVAYFGVAYCECHPETRNICMSPRWCHMLTAVAPQGLRTFPGWLLCAVHYMRCFSPVISWNHLTNTEAMHYLEMKKFELRLSVICPRSHSKKQKWDLNLYLFTSQP